MSLDLHYRQLLITVQVLNPLLALRLKACCHVLLPKSVYAGNAVKVSPVCLLLFLASGTAGIVFNATV